MSERPEEETPDFKAAEECLRAAKAAYERGDQQAFIVARYLLAVALDMTGVTGVRLHTAHLKVS